MGMWNGEVYGHLIPDGEGDSTQLLERKLVLGQLEGCDITFRCASVPPQLCRLSWENGLWRICNISDPPALVVNGRPTTETLLFAGDVIHIGSRRYTLDYTPQSDDEQRPGGETGSQNG